MKFKALVPLALLSTLIACEQKEEMQAEAARLLVQQIRDGYRHLRSLL